jgi:asparagine synthetase B (glutamine-hydrolysing)
MCGIFGLIYIDTNKKDLTLIQKYIKLLFKLSESRGSEASGLAIKTNEKIYVYKEPISPSNYIESNKFQYLFNRVNDDYFNNEKLVLKPISIIGHSRLATNGGENSNLNNHPVIKSGLVGVHNGIIVNVDDLYNEFPMISRKYEVDTEVLLDLLRYFLENNLVLPDAIKKIFSLIYGETSLAIHFTDGDELLIATNTGSLYYCISNDKTKLIFASEKYFLEQIITNGEYKKYWDKCEIFHLKANYCNIINIKTLDIFNFSFRENNIINNDIFKDKNKNVFYKIEDITDYKINSKKMSTNIQNDNDIKELIKREINKNSHSIKNLKRCTKCLLPETFPFITFDQNGVCNYCRDYEKISVKGEDALEDFIKPYRSNDDEPDCIVGFSGGRDSSYMLHYVKKVLKMNPIAFSYDWGMITDLGRRNQARLCAKLGVEHIWISANIPKKRENVQKNIEAWLNKPSLGMVPLLMAGDKQFFYYAHRVLKQTKTKIIFFGSNPLEVTNFKLGFCGIKEGKKRITGQILTGISIANKIKLAAFYGKQYLTNFKYINSSLFDTIHAYYSSYLLPDVYEYFYQYIPWDENYIVNLLRNEYDWEIAKDTSTTWRIGDGTAAFYNYIYYTVAGFSEFDTFRSNQIREGIISREDGLRLVNNENIPRYESLKWYSETIGFDLKETLERINSIPKLYKTEFN